MNLRSMIETPPSAPIDPMEISGHAKMKAAAFNLRPAQQLLMLVLNYLPLMQIVVIAAVVVIPWAHLGWRIAACIAVLYVVPALAARLLIAFAPIPEGRIRVGTRAFFTWWALANLQMLFSRLPMLEEFMRLVPGLYSLWLRLWGAKIGRLTYWGAGLRILDRSFLRIGDNVIFGAAVRLNPHVLARNEQGEMELLLASIVVGDRTMVGGYSLLTAGTEIAADECTRALMISSPFSRWKNGKRTTKTDSTP
jgi:hypothetical protein